MQKQILSPSLKDSVPLFSLFWLHILLQPVVNYLPGVDPGKIWRIPCLGGTENIRGHTPQCTFQLGSRRQGSLFKILPRHRYSRWIFVEVGLLSHCQHVVAIRQDVPKPWGPTAGQAEGTLHLSTGREFLHGRTHLVE